MSQLVLLHFCFTRQHRHASRSRGLSFGVTRRVRHKAHQPFDCIDSMTSIRRRVESESIHSTHTLKLDSISSELVEYRSTSAAERHDVASVALLADRYDR